MGYKRIEPNMTFAELSLFKSMEHNRSLKRLEKINQVIVALAKVTASLVKPIGPA